MTSLMTNAPLRCVDCHMTFASAALLQKHRSKFCVGGGFGDPRRLRKTGGGSHGGTPTGHDEPKPSYGLPATRKGNGMVLAEEHGRQMARIQSRSQDLEKQKEGIERRLVQLQDRDLSSAQSDVTSLVEELRRQELKNKQHLEDLRKQLSDVMATRDRNPFNSIRGHGDSLVAEIGAMRQTYLQSGGNDPRVIQQMALLQEESRDVDRQNARKGRRDPYSEDLGKQMVAIELENERLQEDVMSLQGRNVGGGGRQRHGRTWDDDDVYRLLKADPVTLRRLQLTT